MLIESGEVVAVDSDAVWVETVGRSTCGKCVARKGCGHGLLGELGSGRRNYIRVLPGKVLPAQCRVGDRVDIALPEAAMLRGALLVYLVPVLLMLAGAAAAAACWPDLADPAAVAGAAAGLLLGLLAVRTHALWHQHDPALQPVLVARHRTDLQPLELA
jgi:sigma-E factor negative regulatory protein RseC